MPRSYRSFAPLLVLACAAGCLTKASSGTAPEDGCAQLADAQRACGLPATQVSCEEASFSSALAACARAPCASIPTCIGVILDAGEVPLPDVIVPTHDASPPSSLCRGGFADLGTCSTCAETSCCDAALACAVDSACRSAMAECQALSGKTRRDCAMALSRDLNDESRKRLGRYYNCAEASCDRSCGFPQE